MQYKAYLLAACLAAGLPMQACSQDVTQGRSNSLLQINSKDSNVVSGIDPKQTDPELIAADRHFLSSSSPLENLYTIPRENISSIEMYAINYRVIRSVPLEDPESIPFQSSFDEDSIGLDYHYKVPREKTIHVLNMLNQVKSIRTRKMFARYDLNLWIRVSYTDGRVIDISTEMRNEYNSYLIGQIRRLDGKIEYINFSYYDIRNIFNGLGHYSVLDWDDIYKSRKRS